MTNKINKTPSYDIDSVKTLEGIEAIRTRPGMYIGSVEEEGINHITLEIISNSIDEYLANSCDNIAITINSKERNIYVSDNGRGIPAGIREDGENVLESLCTKLHSGAKFAQDGSTGYNSSGGMNGIGLTAANALSKSMTIRSLRDKKSYEAKFAQGKLIDYKESKDDNKTTGTRISFYPDKEIFKDNFINIKWLKKTVQELSYLCRGLQFEVTIDGKTEIIKSENGLLDYVTSLNKSKFVIKQPLHFIEEDKNENMKLEVAMMYNDNYSDTVKIYTNNIPNPEGGTHLTGFRTSFTSAINKYARDNKLLKDKDDNLTGTELAGGQILVLNINMPDPVFSGQTKTKLTSTEARTFATRVSKTHIADYLNANPKDAKTIIEKALKERQAKEAAKKARELIRKPTVAKNTLKAKVELSSKLTDCSSKNRKNCELFLVEGDSAAGSAKQGRDPIIQAIMALRGKVLNAAKNDINKLLGNKEINDIIVAIGASFGDNFDISKIRYDKVIIMSDSDVDGRRANCQ